MGREHEAITIHYGAYKTRHGFAGIVKVGNGRWAPDGFVASYSLEDALQGALESAIEEGGRFVGDWQVTMSQHPGGIVSSPWRPR